MKIIRKVEYFFNEYECSYACLTTLFVITSSFLYIYFLHFGPMLKSYFPVFVENIYEGITGYFYHIHYDKIAETYLYIPSSISENFGDYVLAPIYEEIVFRFFFFEVINRVIIKNKFYAACLTSFIFMLAHLYSFHLNYVFYNIISMRLFAIFVSGLLYQKIYIDKGLLKSMFFHSFDNFAIFIYVIMHGLYLDIYLYLHNLALDIYLYLHSLFWDIYGYFYHLLMNTIIFLGKFILRTFYNEDV